MEMTRVAVAQFVLLRALSVAIGVGRNEQQNVNGLVEEFGH
jgi:hypothetical protein